jgi:hypothetical protein
MEVRREVKKEWRVREGGRRREMQRQRMFDVPGEIVGSLARFREQEARG